MEKSYTGWTITAGVGRYDLLPDPAGVDVDASVDAYIRIVTERLQDRFPGAEVRIYAVPEGTVLGWRDAVHAYGPAIGYIANEEADVEAVVRRELDYVFEAGDWVCLKEDAAVPATSTN